MKELTTGWKLFRLVCVLQLIAVGLQLILSAGGLVTLQRLFYSLMSTLIYLGIFLFLYQGLSIINYNYPDTPLSSKQKKYFNWLYLFNFLAIAFLFAQVVSEWRSTIPLLKIMEGAWLSYLLFGFSLLTALVVFMLHLVFLAGMYKLRRLIYQNSIESWQQQFSDSGK